MNIIFSTIFIVGILSRAPAQENSSIAIIPLFHDRLQPRGGDERIQLQSQRVIIFVYRNAAAVYLDAHFLNTESDSLTHDIALPSTGHMSIHSNIVSNGIFGAKLWVSNEHLELSISEGNRVWCSIAPSFASHEEKTVHALFWVQTSLADIGSAMGEDSALIPDGRRGFLVDMQHASAWKDIIQSLDVTIVLRESITQKNSRVSVEPKNYFTQHSAYFWSLENVEPSFSDDISFLYSPTTTMTSHWNTLAKLSEYTVHTAYDELLNYVQKLDEK